MCGICGIYDPHHKRTSSQIETGISRMMADFAYRGPDAKGTHFDPARGVGLGHVRLSIIDLAGGQQPMSSADGRLRIVFNGEIYNFKEEREALEKTGVRFQTHSDTEVILALYERYGVDAWQRLRGQFALGLWDARDNSFLLARDRLGEKPLVYSHHQDSLFFASELKALLRAPTLPSDLDPSILGLYFLMQHVPAPGTLIQGARKLPPGYYLKATPQGIDVKPYWRPAMSLSLAHRPEKETIDRFRSLFEEAVRLCTVSDVPIGTYLSGGLDSTSVTWAVKKARPEALHSFAIFNRDGYQNHPDWKYAQEAAAHLGTEHHNVFYELPELMRQIPEFVEKTDEPFEGPTALVSLYLSRFTRQHVKVVLTGTGGDELLGGYQAYYRRLLKTQTAWQWIDRLPVTLRSFLGKIGAPLYPPLARLAMPHGERRVTASLTYHAQWFNLLCPNGQSSTRGKFIEALSTHHSEDQANYFKRFLWEDLVVNHNHSITTMPDATGMACSLEARNPFLDYKLVEFLMQVPPDLLIRKNSPNKVLLVKAMESHLPDSILTRSKEGFSGMTGDQIIRWMRTDGRPLFRDSLLDSLLAKEGFLPKKGIEELWKRYDGATSVKEAIYYQIPIWSATMLELWVRRLRGSSNA